MTFIHRLSHLFGWNTGHVYSWWDSDTNHLMLGFRCTDCGSIEHISSTQYDRGVLGGPSSGAKQALDKMADNARELGLTYDSALGQQGAPDHACALNILPNGYCSVCGSSRFAGNFTQRKNTA